MTSGGKLTVDHQVIRRWVEERSGAPALVRRARSGEDRLMIDLPGCAAGEELEHIDWSLFFRIFEDRGLAFLHQDESQNGETSACFKFVTRGQACRDGA